MDNKKRLDPFATRTNAMAGINRYQKKMLRSELGTSDDPHEHEENIIPNEDQESSDDEFVIFSTKCSRNVDKSAKRHNRDTPLCEISQNVCGAIPSNAGQELTTSVEQAANDETVVKTPNTPCGVNQDVKRPEIGGDIPDPYNLERGLEESRDEALVIPKLTDSRFNLEPTQSYQNILDEENSSDLNKKIEGLISTDVMLSSSLNCCKDNDELHFTSDVAEPSSQGSSNSQSQKTERAVDSMIDFNYISMNVFKEDNDDFPSKNIENAKGPESTDMSTTSQSKENFSAAGNLGLPLNETIGNYDHGNENNAVFKANIIENEDTNIIENEDASIIKNEDTYIMKKEDANIKENENTNTTENEDANVTENEDAKIEKMLDPATGKFDQHLIYPNIIDNKYEHITDNENANITENEDINITEKKEANITILENFEIVLDPANGTFCKNLIEPNVTENKYDHITENEDATYAENKDSNIDILEDFEIILDPETGKLYRNLMNPNIIDKDSNIAENEDFKTDILEDFEVVLDPATGNFCRNIMQKKKDCEVIDTNNENIQEIDTETARNTSKQDTQPPIEPEIKGLESEKKRKRKVTNTFIKSCIDFLDESENKDFSAGSSDEWSAKESGEESSGTEIRRKSKKKKKKVMNETDEINQSEILKKCKKENVSKLRKKKKDQGESYETKKGILIEAKSMKPNPCSEGKCQRSCKNIPEERRNALFKYYWDLTVQRRKDWLVRCAQRVCVKRKKTDHDISRRNWTYAYYLNDGDGYVQVCQKFVLDTLDITQRHLLYTLSNEVEKMARVEQRHTNVSIKFTEEVINYAKQYIESLPAVPSHYCRQDTKKVYLPQELKNISNLYRLYLEKVKEDSQPVKLSEKMFRKIFTEEYNISFHSRKKDKCVQCTKFENQENDVTEEDKANIEEHKEEKKASYARFKLHQNLMDPETLTTSFDMQKVLNTPHGESMLLYYSRKYAMYNLTFYESGTQNVMCYLWGETDGKRGSQEISSCLYLYLKEIDNRGLKNLLLYCDSCCGQNRNKVVIAALNNFLKSSVHLQVIQINYLIPGHTYMPVDSVHAVIENEVKKLIVWSPSQWPTYIETARKRPRPYKVHVLEHTDFLNFEELCSKTFTPQTAKAVKFQKVRTVTLKKKCPNEIFVKYSMKEDSEVHKFQLHQKSQDAKNTKLRKGKGKGKGKGKNKQNILQEDPTLDPTEAEEIKLKPLYEERLPISVSKYQDLTRLCSNGTIPKRFHEEYKKLPYLSAVPDTLDETDEEDACEE